MKVMKEIREIDKNLARINALSEEVRDLTTVKELEMIFLKQRAQAADKIGRNKK